MGFHLGVIPIFLRQLNTEMSLEKNINYDEMRLKVSEVRQRMDKIAKGGGQKNIDKQHAKGKMTARERIDFLLDEKKPVVEVGGFAAEGMYEDVGGCPSAGVVTVIGYVQGKQCVVVANDATVKAGAWFPMTGKKNLRAQEIAMENRLPIIYLVDSAGVFLPMQDEIFPDKEHFGRMFRNNAIMSGMGIPQIAAVMGSCVAGGAYLPIMSDEALIVKGTGSIFLAGPYLVKAAIGENVDAETLGGADMHNQVSGVCDYNCEDDEDCLSQIKRIISKMGKPQDAGFNRIKSAAPTVEKGHLSSIQSPDNSKPYDVREVIKGIVDNSEFDEFKEEYGKTIVTAYARIDGWAVGIVASQRLIVKSGKGEMQFGGVIYSDSADKTARFIMNCNQKNIPLVFIQDNTGFMVGSRSEQGGIIKDGAKLVNAMANSVVPKFTIIAGNSYGAANYAMCGKAYDPRLIYAWPSAKIAVMGGDQAAKTLLQIQLAGKKGEDITEEQKTEMLKEISDRYKSQTTPFYAASRLWVDGIIDPEDTRTVLSEGIKAANQAPIEKKYNVGVIQT